MPREVIARPRNGTASLEVCGSAAIHPIRDSRSPGRLLVNRESEMDQQSGGLARNFAATSAIVVLSLLSACGGGNGGASGGGMTSVISAPTPSPMPTPTPTSSQYAATLIPFGLSQDRTFDVFGWDAWNSAPVASALQFRWNAATTEYEILPSGSTRWARLKFLGTASPTYDVFASDGTKLSYQVSLSAPTAVNGIKHVGFAQVIDGSNARPYFAFGFATAASDIPTAGSKVCTFGMDEIGAGQLTFDFAVGTVSGYVETFYGSPPTRYQLAQVGYTPGASTSVSAIYDSDPTNAFQARLFGPQGSGIAVRVKGAISGIMTGLCE